MKYTILTICLVATVMITGCEKHPAEPKDSTQKNMGAFTKETTSNATKHSFWQTIQKRQDESLQKKNEYFFFPQHKMTKSEKRDYVRMKVTQRNHEEAAKREWGTLQNWRECTANQQGDGYCSLRHCQRCVKRRRAAKKYADAFK